jgi:hypothetical protein
MQGIRWRWKSVCGVQVAGPVHLNGKVDIDCIKIKTILGSTKPFI